MWALSTYPGVVELLFRFNIVILCDSLHELHLSLSKLILASVFAGFDVALRCNNLFASILFSSLFVFFPDTLILLLLFFMRYEKIPGVS